jgi:hypothetical protein
MKFSLITPLIVTSSVLIIASGANAQNLLQKAKAGIESAAGIVQEAVAEEKPSTGNAAIQAALDEIKKNITKSTELLNQTTKPDEEKIKEFDKMVSDIDGVLAFSQEGGEYEKLINDSVAKNKEKLALMKSKANNPSLPVNQRAAYERKMPILEQTLESLGNNRIKLIRISNDLKKQRENIVQSKQFYIDMVSIDDLVEANRSVENVNASMQTLFEKIEELGEVGTEITAPSGPAAR